jgi:hypothetical protein
MYRKTTQTREQCLCSPKRNNMDPAVVGRWS